MGFPFLSVDRFPFHEGNYACAPPTGIKDHYKPPEGSLRSIFDSREANVVYKRNPDSD